jgi:predicted NBD/HSP70 family sugar kinase
MNILAIDIGGSKLKLLATGQSEPRRARSGRCLDPIRMVRLVQSLAEGWEYEAISIGYPGPTGDAGPRSEPGNLGYGWVGFDYAAAFERPVKIINDAAMQALGSYEGGRMLFLGLGTGLGSALIAENVIVPLELGQLPHRKGLTLGDVLGRGGLDRLGRRTWRRAVRSTIPSLISAFAADYIVVGGGNAKRLGHLPHAVRRGHNLTAFRGGFRLWGVEDVPAHRPDGAHAHPAPASALEWRLI